LKDPKKLRAAIMARLNASFDGCTKLGRIGKSRSNRDKSGDDGLTDEQKNLEQEKLFLEAREQFNQEQMALEKESERQQQIAASKADNNGFGT